MKAVDLSKDELLEILMLLPGPDLIKYCRTSKTIQALCVKHALKLWRYRLIQEFNVNPITASLIKDPKEEYIRSKNPQYFLIVEQSTDHRLSGKLKITDYNLTKYRDYGDPYKIKLKTRNIKPGNILLIERVSKNLMLDGIMVTPETESEIKALEHRIEIGAERFGFFEDADETIEVNEFIFENYDIAVNVIIKKIKDLYKPGDLIFISNLKTPIEELELKIKNINLIHNTIRWNRGTLHITWDLVST